MRSSRLTRLQKDVLEAFFRHEDRFYLTGGGALAGYHLGHREMHDLDLFALTSIMEPSGFMKFSALGVEEQRVNVVVDFEDPAEAWEALGDSYRVEVRIVTWQEPDVLHVPTSSLFRKGDAWAVFAVSSGRAHQRTAEIGRRNGLEAQVLSGLEERHRHRSPE